MTYHDGQQIKTGDIVKGWTEGRVVKIETGGVVVKDRPDDGMAPIIWPWNETRHLSLVRRCP